MLRQQAEQIVAGCPRIDLAGDWRDLPNVPFDLIYCLEVLEHLPGRETRQLVEQIWKAASPLSRVVFSVPNELHLAAVMKGLFRIARRYGSFDATGGHVCQAALGRPPLRRPLSRLGAGNRYYFHHLGFDHRRLARRLNERFVIEQRYGSPFVNLPLASNAELFYVCRKRCESADAQ
jgi:SAM-dependent methyltransferase